MLKAVKGGTKRIVNSLFKQEKFTKIQYKGKSYLIVPSKNQFDMKMEPIILLLGSAFLGDLMALFSYNYLKRKKYPFEYKGLKFIRVPFRCSNGC